MTSTTEIYNLDTGEWRSGADLPMALAYGATVSYPEGSSVLAIGGFASLEDDPVDLIFEYDFEADTWSEFPGVKLGRPRAEMVAIRIEDSWVECE